MLLTELDEVNIENWQYTMSCLLMSSLIRYATPSVNIFISVRRKGLFKTEINFGAKEGGIFTEPGRRN